MTPLLQAKGSIARGEVITAGSWGSEHSRLTLGTRELNIDFLCFNKLSMTVTVSTAILIITEGQFQVFQQFPSSKSC